MSTTDQCGPDRTNDETMWQKMRQLYEKEARAGSVEYPFEEPLLRKAITQFHDVTHSRYVIEDFIGLGGAGLVFLVCDKALQTKRALKFARPLEGKGDFVHELVESEIGTLLELSHPNVMPIYDRGLVELDGRKMPFYTMAYVSGGMNAKHFYSTKRRRSDFIRTISDIVAGIRHMHERHVVHMDLKPSNFLLLPSGHALVADLGSAKTLDPANTSPLTVTYTDQYAHPLLKQHSHTKTDSNRVRGTLARNQLSVMFDLYALGLSLFQLLDLFDTASPHEMDQYTRKYLLLMAARLLNGYNDVQHLALGLPTRAFNEIHYRAAKEVEEDLGKLTGMYDLDRRIPELAKSAPSYVQASTLARTPFTERLGRLLNEPLIRRLAGISQLGLLNALYPTATHNRLEHSLGTYTNTLQYITYLVNDPINPFFRQVMSADDLVATLLAAFMHDLGQYPLAHDLEDAHKVIFRHGTLTNILLSGDRVDVKPLSDALGRRLREDWGTDINRVLAILNADPMSQDIPLKDRLLHSLIDGPIDADKLDYLVRDSRECGVPYGRVIDFPRLLRTLTVVYYREKERFFISLGIHEKGRVAAECVAFARYAMFSQVYWHHTARAAKAMLHRAVWEWLERDNRSNDNKRSEFHTFLLALGRPKGAQTTLFEESSQMAVKVVPETFGERDWSQFHPADVNVLHWIRVRTSQDGIVLVDDILSRRFYKRLAVVSEGRNQKLWTDLQQVRRLKSIEAMLLLSRNLQRLLVERVKFAKDKGEKMTSTAADIDAVTAGIQVLESKASILIDIPGSRLAEDEVLRYLPESHHREHKDLFAQAPTMEDSKVWEVVGGKVFSIAGKVRVFAHPAVAVLSTSVLGPEAVEAGLAEAARITLETM